MRFKALLISAIAIPTFAGTLTYGTEDCLTLGCYGTNDPTAGATLLGLAPDAVTVATDSFGHGFPFTPTAGDFPGTDQIYVGSVQTAAHDGYSSTTQRINGPDVMVMDYSSLVGAGQTVNTITLGIAADDFQFPAFGQPFIVTINGVVNAALTTQLESLNQTGPVVQFFTIGLAPTIDTPSHTLTLSIDEGGDGGDGYAVDFLTVGVTTSSSATPEPATFLLTAVALAALLYLPRSRAISVFRSLK
jgi:hypothetical protein